MKQLIFAALLLLITDIMGMSVTNGDFVDYKSGKAPAEWSIVGNLECKPAEKGIALTVTSAGTMHAALIQNIFDFGKNMDYFLSADFIAEHNDAIYLQVKLYKDKQEKKRVQVSPKLVGRQKLVLAFNTEDADQIVVLFRMPYRNGDEKRPVQLFSINIEEAPKTPTAQMKKNSPGDWPEELLRYEIVPGYEVCSIYLNHCLSDSEKNFKSKLLYRKESETEWHRSLALVYMPDEKCARGSLFDLTENTPYRLKMVIDDNGKKEEIEKSFRTNNINVPIAKTIVLDEKTPMPLKIETSGTADGYIRYTAKPGVILNGGDKSEYAVFLNGVSYVILDGLTVSGARVHGIIAYACSDIQITNCNISGFSRAGTHRPEIDGKYYENGHTINQDAGIRIHGSRRILVERNYIHDPRGTANSWFYAHPEGPNALNIGKTREIAIRYNDFIGSDAKRWNDVVEGKDNGKVTGSAYRDAEISGNNFMFANDDGMELDGGQLNARFFANRTEGTLCGVSTAPCLLGPAYYYRNIFCGTGTEFGYVGVGFKNIFQDAGKGRMFFLHNTIVGLGNGFSSMGGNNRDKELLRMVSRNNLVMVKDSLIAYDLLQSFRCDFDYDLLHSSDPAIRSISVFQKEFGQEQHGVSGKPVFTDAENGLYLLKAESPGYHTGVSLPGFTENGKPSMGAFQPGIITDIPCRPIAFHASASKLCFSSESPTGWNTRSITVTVTDPGFSSSFNVFRNEASRFIRVTPDAGMLAYGKPITLTVSIDPGHITSAQLNSGAFIVRLPNGFSRVVTVYADSSNDRALLARDRKNVISGNVTKLPNGDWQLDFELKIAGKYYLFAQFAAPAPQTAWLTHNGNAQTLVSVRGTAEKRLAPVWKGIGPSDLKENPQTFFTAGKHTFIVHLKNSGSKILETAVAEKPGMLLNAPFSDLIYDESLPTIHLAGDSTVAEYKITQAPMNGWGQQLIRFCKNGVRVRNLARGGYSTISFLNQEYWDNLISGVKAGDYVMIQFGHNDQKEKNPEIYAAVNTTYPTILKRFIGDVRNKGAYPVLITSIQRRTFCDNGEFLETLGKYPETVRHIAQETATPLIDLNVLTRKLYENAGAEGSTAYFTYTLPREYPGYPTGSKDNSHLNVIGAEKVAKLLVNAAKENKLPLEKLFQ